MTRGIRVLFCLTFFLSVGAGMSLADIGRIQTKRQRLRSEEKHAVALKKSGADYRTIHARFLAADYAGVLRLSEEYFKGPSDKANAGDVLYLEAMCLLQLGQSEEARRKFSELETISISFEQKASASASIGDSYYFENQPNKAYENYRNTLAKYPQSSQTPYLLYQLLELSVKLYKQQDAENYKRRILSEYSGSQAASDAVSRFPTVLSNNPTAVSLGKMAIEENLLFTVQVGSFAKSKNARALTNKLHYHGYDAHVEFDSKNRRYRVRVGKTATRAEAQALEERLKKEGYPTKIYP